MSTPVPPPSPPDLRASIMRLAQFRPFGVGQVQVEGMLRALVITAIHEAGDSGLGSLAACRDACRTLWGVETEIDELRTVTTTLCDQGKLSKAGGVYRLTDDARAELTEQIVDSDRTEGEAFADWEIAVRGLRPSVEQRQLDLLRADLVTWLQHIVTRHGIEAAMLLYPEDERGARVLAEVEEYGLGFLPRREEVVDQLRPQALYLFIHRPTVAQRAYLANLMTTSYMLATFTLDPRAAGQLQQLTAGQRVYLDTNIVYAALNLQGPRAYLSASRILQLSRDLGYQVAVTPWTVEEMRYSLRRARKDLAKTTLPPRALAEIAAEATGEESFVTAYWRKYKETGVTIEDFSAMYTELDALIERLGITITDQGCTAVNQNEEAVNEQVALIERFPGGQIKPEPVKVHDVKHRLLVERLRGDGNRHFSNAGYWFLTRDSVLIPYGRAQRHDEDAPPFAVSMTAWAYIVRSFTPRTEDYDRTLVDLLDTPSIRPKGMVAYQTVADVLGRVDHMVSDSSEDIATRLLVDHAAMTDIDTASGEERDAKIENAITAKTDEMRRQVTEAEAARVDERDARLAAERETAATRAEAGAHRARADELASTVKAEREAREAAERAATENARDATAANEQIETKQREHADVLKALRDDLDRQRAVGRSVLAGVLFVLALAIAIVPLATGWITSGWPWVGVFGAAGLVAYAGLALLFTKKTAAAIATAAVVVIGLANDLHGFAPRDHHTAKPASGSTK